MGLASADQLQRLMAGHSYQPCEQHEAEWRISVVTPLPRLSYVNITVDQSVNWQCVTVIISADEDWTLWAPTVWNSLHVELCEPAVSNVVFRRTLKTILFARYYSPRAQLRCVAWNCAIYIHFDIDKETKIEPARRWTQFTVETDVMVDSCRRRRRRRRL